MSEKIIFESTAETPKKEFFVLASKQLESLKSVSGRDAAKRIVISGTEEILNED
ncbi:hypothetical protein KKG46_00320 [Patescibacteria group bacterium]|nr:hypothetical protein [Patescibacteria group bacterium]